MRVLFSAAAGLLLAACPAWAQSAGLADMLAANVNCTSAGDARASLERNLSQAPPDTTQDAIVSALRQLAGRDDLCTELKNAARDFADQAVSAEPEIRADEQVASASSAIVAATLAEAELRAANLKFEVGPPPRFMTKERISGP